MWSINGAVTYTLGLYVNANLLDSRFHEPKVHVKRSGLLGWTRWAILRENAPARYSIALTFPSMKAIFVSAYT